MEKKGILSILLCAALLITCLPSAAFAESFHYQHDPHDHPSAMLDIVEDSAAIYGFRPSEAGSLKLYASADWSDPEIVAQGRADRIAYHESIATMYDLLQAMQAQGKSTEEIARAVSTRRNEIRLEAYADDPEGLAALKERNLEKYGHEEGPLPDELLEKYGSWERVMEKSFSANAGMDACLGLYDDYYFLYAALGDVPADLTITLPTVLDCTYKKTAVLTPEIETNALSYTVTFVSDDPTVAAIDETGELTGMQVGETAVRCILTDAGGFIHTSEPCKVQVRLNFWQWLIRILLFGWIWY